MPQRGSLFRTLIINSNVFPVKALKRFVNKLPVVTAGLRAQRYRVLFYSVMNVKAVLSIIFTVQRDWSAKLEIKARRRQVKAPADRLHIAFLERPQLVKCFCWFALLFSCARSFS